MLSMLILAAASAAQPRILVPSTGVPAGHSSCYALGVQLADGKADTPVRAQKLNELPNADEYKLVLRTDENGCEKPLIVRYNIGSAPIRQR